MHRIIAISHSNFQSEALSSLPLHSEVNCKPAFLIFTSVSCLHTKAPPLPPPQFHPHSPCSPLDQMQIGSRACREQHDIIKYCQTKRKQQQQPSFNFSPLACRELRLQLYYHVFWRTSSKLKWPIYGHTSSCPDSLHFTLQVWQDVLFQGLQYLYIYCK